MIYEYECNDCKHIFDASCKMDDRDEQQKCPNCNITNSTRRITAPGANAFIPSDRLGRIKVSDGFNDVLQNISNKAIGGNYLKDKLRR